MDAGAGALGVSGHDEPDPGLPSVDSRPATNTNRPDVTTGYHALAVAERRPRADECQNLFGKDPEGSRIVREGDDVVDTGGRADGRV